MHRSTRPPDWLGIMKIHGALVQLLHHGQDPSAGTRGNEQPTTDTIRLNELNAIRAGLPN
jgi:hypothetical protein